MSARTRNVLIFLGAVYVGLAVTAALVLTAQSDRITKTERRAETNAQINRAQNHERAVRTRQACLAAFRVARDRRRDAIEDYKKLPIFLSKGLSFGIAQDKLLDLAKADLRHKLWTRYSNNRLPKFCPQRKWFVYLPRSIYPNAKPWRSRKT